MEKAKAFEAKPKTGIDLDSIRKKVQSCIQCGTCTASCPNEFAMDLTPRHMWRMVLMGRDQEVFESKTFILCSACYTCSLRCPRGLPLTEVMANLKQVAAKQNMARYKSSILFYKNFVNSIRRHGRVNEMEFMTLYFMGMKNPMLPLNFTRLGLRLMDKRKIPLEVPRFSNFPKPLEPIFKKVEEMEAR